MMRNEVTSTSHEILDLQVSVVTFGGVVAALASIGPSLLWSNGAQTGFAPLGCTTGALVFFW
jgi:hypothetical protein